MDRVVIYILHVLPFPFVLHTSALSMALTAPTMIRAWHVLTGFPAGLLHDSEWLQSGELNGASWCLGKVGKQKEPQRSRPSSTRRTGRTTYRRHDANHTQPRVWLGDDTDVLDDAFALLALVLTGIASMG
ncbi:hypothetical protein IWX49DRAFT_120866 [Phyllosticta citricarpa]|uniref:Uncharacterized protein n=1 Tax=Phyllosticta citricarpa TaxID=55181 RepID=A0ABR1MEV5_9PEZI